MLSSHCVGFLFRAQIHAHMHTCTLHTHTYYTQYTVYTETYYSTCAHTHTFCTQYCMHIQHSTYMHNAAAHTILHTQHTILQVHHTQYAHIPHKPYRYPVYTPDMLNMPFAHTEYTQTRALYFVEKRIHTHTIHVHTHVDGRKAII